MVSRKCRRFLGPLLVTAVFVVFTLQQFYALQYRLDVYPRVCWRSAHANAQGSELNGRPVRIFCWIPTSARRQLSRRAVDVEGTWPRRCDGHAFYTDDDSKKLPAAFEPIFTGLNDTFDQLGAKVRLAMEHTHAKYLRDFDWFFKADDDTYVHVENLRHFLQSKFNSAYPHYVGFRWWSGVGLPFGYNGGGAGYALSRPALALLVAAFAANATTSGACPVDANEDLMVGRCLQQVGVCPAALEWPWWEKEFRMVPNRPLWASDDPIKNFRGWKTGQLISMHRLRPEDILRIHQHIYNAS